MLKIIFIPVKDPISKLAKIYQVSLTHFEKKEKLLVLASDLKTIEFLDLWLWKYSAEGFLPHCQASSSAEEWIRIGKDKNDFPEATALFNLQSEVPSFPLKDYKILYEWDDLSSPEKKQSSHQRFLFYRGKGYVISTSPT